ncbi:outer membrane protein assembly factor BamB family protein [Nocardiopsis quinghaiensis]|uniref:outer membrane protein assembly factor BamB family protein n=1 Tax=Nocardiopsis quinghaiensis TaxID=464995 RepID=UPI00123B9D29|nr:PQQ-binding-like beta-propeller repeat protein [Nocardiopsis quinghaiensis]
MGRRLRDVLGWSGVAILVGALALTAPRVFGFSEHAASGQNLSFLVGATLLMAVAVLSFVSLTATRDPAHVLAHSSLAGVLGRVAIALAGLVLVWATFPTRHLTLAVDNERYRMFPEAVTGLWVGVCLVALGMALVLCLAAVLSLHRWKRVLTGLAAGALAVVLVWTLVPMAVTRFLLVEHTGAEAAGESAPVPATVSRVGWTWQPEHPVVGVERGPRGPLVRYTDGFVALDGATGEELWTYRLPYSRQVMTGMFAGQDRYAHLSHVAEPGPEPETRTMVVLDTATGEVVRDAPMPLLVPEGKEDPTDALYLTPNVRVLRVREEGGERVVGHATDSTELLWEFELDLPEGHLCLWGNDGGVRGYGDRVLVARLCLKDPEVEYNLSAALADMDVPESAVESVIALDATTGRQVWRHDWTPEDLRIHYPPGVSASGEVGGEPVAVTRGGMFALADGEPIQALPSAPEGAEDRTLALSAEGAVVLRDQEDEEPTLLLRTDASGVVVQRTRTERNLELWLGMGQAAVLDEQVAMPYVAYDADHKLREFAVLPLDDAETAEAWTRIGLDDGPVPESVDAWLRDHGHSALSTPGAVVSYLENPNTPGLGPAPLYGLVP